MLIEQRGAIKASIGFYLRRRQQERKRKEKKLFLIFRRDKAFNRFRFLRGFFADFFTLIDRSIYKVEARLQNIPFTYLLVFIYRSFLKRRTVTHHNAEDYPNVLFNRSLDASGSNMHDTISDSS